MNKKPLLAFGILLILSFGVFTYLQKDKPRIQQLSGFTMGTIVYSVKFMGFPDDLSQSEIDKELRAFNQS